MSFRGMKTREDRELYEYGKKKGSKRKKRRSTKMFFHFRRTTKAKPDLGRVISAEVIAELRRANPEGLISLHKDSAGSHTARKAIAFSTQLNLESLHHLPYSPDLNPNDLSTFPKTRNGLRG
ncbi:hypothetical protein Trydic_g21224 [Trypoxylus dichotomus]